MVRNTRASQGVASVGASSVPKPKRGRVRARDGGTRAHGPGAAKQSQAGARREPRATRRPDQEPLAALRRQAQAAIQRKTRQLHLAAPRNLRALLQELEIQNERLRRAQQELHASQAAQEKERYRCQGLFDLAPDGYVVTDLKGRIQEANVAAGRLLGQSPASLVGAVLPLFFTERSMYRLRDLLAEVRQGRLPKEQRIEVSLPQADRQLACEVTFNTVQRAEGQVVGLRWLLRAIAHRKHIEEALRRANTTLTAQARELTERTQALEQTTEQLNAFCLTVAHDLSAPMRTLLGFTKVLQEDFPAQLGPRGVDYLSRMQAIAERQVRVVGDLLAYMSLSRTQVALDPIDLAQAVAEACADLHSEIRRTHARIQTDAVSGRIQANRASLHLVLSNLLSNALKFVAPGNKPQVRLWTEPVSGSPDGGFVRLWLQDNGIGIPAKFRTKIFGVFERLHPKEVYPGTGIGLALVKQAVEQMAGRVGVEPAPEQGSRFWVELRAAA